MDLDLELDSGVGTLSVPHENLVRVTARVDALGGKTADFVNPLMSNLWPMLSFIAALAFVVVGVLVYVELLPNTHYLSPKVLAILVFVVGGIGIVVVLIHAVLYVTYTRFATSAHNFNIFNFTAMFVIGALMSMGILWSFLAHYGWHLSPLAPLPPFAPAIYDDWTRVLLVVYGAALYIFYALAHFVGVSIYPHSVEMSFNTGGEFHTISKALAGHRGGRAMSAAGAQMNSNCQKFVY